MDKQTRLITKCLGALLTANLMACGEQTEQIASVNQSVALTPQAQLDELSKTLLVKYNFNSNMAEDCPDLKGKKVKTCYSADITLTNPTDSSFSDWALYYSQVYPTYASASDDFTLLHINGDIHQISPKASFQGFKAGQTTTVRLWSKSTLITESELMPNYWLSADGLTPNVIASTKTTIDPETGLELQPYVVPFDNLPLQAKSAHNDINPVATAAWLFDDNEAVQAKIANGAVERAIVPTPSQLTFNDNAQRLDLKNGVNLTLSGVKKQQIVAAMSRLAALGVTQSPNGVPLHVSVKSRDANVSGSYTLDVTNQGINILAGDAAGAFYALQSLAALKALDATSLPVVSVKDSPRYQYRGQHVDVARNFHGKDFIIDLIKQMGAYKLNKLHLHLAEDEGWRLEIPSLPELTDVGAKRCLDMSDRHCLQPQLGGAGQPQRDGYLSVADYKEILQVASAHHVQVIPSLDMPGHSRAAVKAMEARYKHYMTLEQPEEATRYLLTDLEDKTAYRSIQHYNDNTLNICMESTYTFIDRVLTDLKAMHDNAGHPLAMYHIGADETAGAWIESPACHELINATNIKIKDPKHLGAHFIERVSNMVADKGISVGGWNDGMGETDPANMPQDVYSYIWGTFPGGAHRQASEQANRNWNVVLSVPDLSYFDFPYEIDPKERGYKWASRRVNSRNVFNYMPDNLPAHAEFRVDTLGQPFVSDDRQQVDEHGNITHKPMPKGYKVAGIQGQLWSETVRSTEQAQYMVYPRIISLAERAWHQAEWELAYKSQGEIYSKDTSHFSSEMRQLRDNQWYNFANVVAQKELPKLEHAGVFYRLPTVGAKVIDGKLHANVILAGLAIEYRVNQGEWLDYTGPVAVNGSVTVRTRTFDGRRAGRMLQVQ